LAKLNLKPCEKQRMSQRAKNSQQAGPYFTTNTTLIISNTSSVEKLGQTFKEIRFL